ncbi:MAG TPA: hypothetical protein VLZ28_06755 [Daejeonella sp.]|nr:hypothetical protein [Daejeonella sp.]
MKRLTFSFSVLVLTFIWIYHTAATDYNPAINSIIGDISYVKKFGHLPSPGTDRDLRISTHLAYTENLLRSTKTSYNTETNERRSNILDLLNDYRVAGSFPDHSNRINNPRQCDIDKDRNTCAICYLVEKSAGKQAAQNINKDFKNCRIAGVDSEALTAWIRDNGLTREEVEIIQPSYN